MEVDQIKPISLKGKDEWENLQLLHRHCHDRKTAVDMIDILKHRQSENLQKLSQEWDKAEWIWREDFP